MRVHLADKSPPIRATTMEVADELTSYLCFEEPLAIRILDYMLAFQKQKDPQTGLLVQIPRSLVLTETALYLVDEDYSGWPPPIFQENYDYLVRSPYKVLSQFLIVDLACVVSLLVAISSSVFVPNHTCASCFSSGNLKDGIDFLEPNLRGQGAGAVHADLGAHFVNRQAAVAVSLAPELELEPALQL